MADEEYDEEHFMVQFSSAVTQFNIVKESLDSVGYNQPIIGFSWESDTFWNTAKRIADQNGLKLAKFILDLKAGCEDAKIQLVGHSLGARVILNALYELHTNMDLVTDMMDYVLDNLPQSNENKFWHRISLLSYQQLVHDQHVHELEL